MVTQRSSSKDVQSVTSDFWNLHLVRISSGTKWHSWLITKAAAQSSSLTSGRSISTQCTSVCVTDSPASRSSIECDTANTSSQVQAERTTSPDHLLNYILKKNRTVSVALFYCKMFFPKTSLAKNPLRFGSCLNLASKMNWCLNWDKKKKRP